MRLAGMGMHGDAWGGGHGSQAMTGCMSSNIRVWVVWGTSTALMLRNFHEHMGLRLRVSPREPPPPAVSAGGPRYESVGNGQ